MCIHARILMLSSVAFRTHILNKNGRGTKREGHVSNCKNMFSSLSKDFLINVYTHLNNKEIGFFPKKISKLFKILSDKIPTQFSID